MTGFLICSCPLEAEYYRQFFSICTVADNAVFFLYSGIIDP